MGGASVNATVEHYRTRAAYIRANVNRHPDPVERANLLVSASRYEAVVQDYNTHFAPLESRARRRKRLQAAAVVAAPVVASGLFLVPSLLTSWADVSLQTALAVIGGSLAVTAVALHLQWLIAWLEARRPMHESAREAELKYGDRPVRRPRTESGAAR
jgi:hypothetical protein